jgi:hypothetical protein
MGNGNLDVSTLVQIDGEPGDLLRRDAAGYWNALQRDFRRAMGHGIAVREAYRPLGVQIGYFVTRYTKTSRNTGLWYDGSYWVKKAGVPAAARPGTSKHGDGLAVDVNVDSFNSAAYRWLAANAGRYGFGNNQGRNDGEPWHWVFGETRPTVSPAGVSSQPIDNDGNDMADISEEQMNRIAQKAAETTWKIALRNEVDGATREAGTLLGNIEKAISLVPSRVLTAPVARAGEFNDDGSPKYTELGAWIGFGQKFVDYIVAEVRGTASARPDLDEAELGEAIAAKLAPIVAASVGKLTDAEVDALAAAVVNEQARRLTKS